MIPSAIREGFKIFFDNNSREVIGFCCKLLMDQLNSNDFKHPKMLNK